MNNSTIHAAGTSNKVYICVEEYLCFFGIEQVPK